MAFIRTQEDFICETCGFHVSGNGYTNHCPQCLWSKHVDIDPGDRAAECGGMMEPVGMTTKGDTFVIHHHCVRCGFERRTKSLPEDNSRARIALSTKIRYHARHEA